jgi:ribonuclease HI
VQVAICRDEKGNIIQAISQINNSYSPNEGEAMAAQLAISLATSLNLDLFIIEGDSEVVVQSLQNPKFVRDWRISSIILNSLDSIPSASFWEARKISRNANFCSHSMARWVAVGSHSGSIPMSFIPFLISSSSSGDPLLFSSLM